VFMLKEKLPKTLYYDTAAILQQEELFWMNQMGVLKNINTRMCELMSKT